MPKLLLCWETGAGRGHVTTLATVARGAAGLFSSEAALARLEHIDELLLWSERIHSAPLLLRQTDEQLLGPSASEARPEKPGTPARFAYGLANWLGRRGFRDRDLLRIRIRWWRKKIEETRADLVVADYAPNAILAARSLGVPTLVTGTALSVPPAHLERLPVFFRSDDAVLLDEKRTVEVINDVLSPLGLEPLQHLAGLYDCTLQMPRGVSVLDPYAKWRTGPRVLPLDRLPPRSEGTGSEVFIYFSTEELEDPEIWKAMTMLPLTARLVAPGLSSEAAARLAQANSRITIETELLGHTSIVERARLIVCAGQAGMTTLGLLAGVPMVLLPLHAEQALNAQNAVTTGTCRALLPRQRTAEETVGQIAELWEDTVTGAAARSGASSLRAEFSQGAVESFRQATASIL